MKLSTLLKWNNTSSLLLRHKTGDRTHIRLRESGTCFHWLPCGEKHRVRGKRTFRFHAAEPIEDVNALLPDSCTIRLGDSFDAVCDKLGADNDMVQQILSMEKDARERYYHPSNNQDESFSVYTDKLYSTDSRYYHFYLKNGSYHYTFTFTKNDDMLCCINVGADDVS